METSICLEPPTPFKLILNALYNNGVGLGYADWTLDQCKEEGNSPIVEEILMDYLDVSQGTKGLPPPRRHEAPLFKLIS